MPVVIKNVAFGPNLYINGHLGGPGLHYVDC